MLVDTRELSAKLLGDAVVGFLAAQKGAYFGYREAKLLEVADLTQDLLRRSVEDANVFGASTAPDNTHFFIETNRP